MIERMGLASLDTMIIPATVWSRLGDMYRIRTPEKIIVLNMRDCVCGYALYMDVTVRFSQSSICYKACWSVTSSEVVPYIFSKRCHRVTICESRLFAN